MQAGTLDFKPPASGSGAGICGHQINHCLGSEERPLRMGQCTGLLECSVPGGEWSQPWVSNEEAGLPKVGPRKTCPHNET